MTSRAVMWFVWVMAVVAIMSGCGGGETASAPGVTALASATSEPTATDIPTETSEPTATDAPTATPKPSATPAPTATDVPTATPKPSATPVPEYASGGLGQDRAWWEKLYGAGEPALLGQMFNRFEVMFADDRARHIERQHAVAMPFVGAQREIRELLPADAEFVELTMPADRPGTWIELYRSPSLAERFVGAVWPNAEPGEFVVIYKLEDDQKASRVIVATGNDP